MHQTSQLVRIKLE